MMRRSFFHRLAGLLGGVVGLGVESPRTEVPVRCQYCGTPALPRRRHGDATEYVCLQCAWQGTWPLAAYAFTRKANDPTYYVFFPPDIDAMLSRDIPPLDIDMTKLRAPVAS